MLLKLRRKDYESNYTRGELTIDDDLQPFCYTLEDKVREEKIKGVTAIPKGVYEVKFRKEVTPLTARYRVKYEDFFSYHLELQDVPNYTGVYIHIGNKPEHTEGCLLVGYGKSDGTLPLLKSTAAYRDLYIRVSAALLRGETVFVDVTDLPNM